MPTPNTNTKTESDFFPVKYNLNTNVLTNVLIVFVTHFVNVFVKYKRPILPKYVKLLTKLVNRSKTVFVNDIDDINVVIVFVNHFVNVFVR